MALWWYRMGFSRVLLLLCFLLWQTVSPVLPATSCPSSCSCPGVKEVHCTFRHLPTIPKNLPKDTERVNLGYNSLTEVDGSEFRSLRQLEMLMLHGNDISTVHSGAFYSLRSLQILKLSYNKLTLVKPGLFEGLASLIRLHLDHNLITFIEPYSFSGLSSLKLLQLEGNLLKEIHPHTFVTVSLLGAFWTSGLKHLHLSDNMLEQLPAPLLLTAPKLELLSLHGNPWTCDCQLHWLIEWNANHEGVIKCKKERDSGSVETCPRCYSPQSLNGSLFLDMTQAKLPCERAVIHSPLKQWDSPAWGESDAEPDLPYTRDLERPLGHLTFVLSDSHGNSAHVVCDVRRPAESSPMTWAENPRAPGEVSVNVSLVTVLECEIDRDTLQNLWRLVAYYYESPAVLERGSHRGNTTRATYQYSQVVNENSPYFTDLKGYLMAEPSWLLQPKVTLQLNRQQTTTKKLVMDFTTKISEQTANNRRGDSGDNDIDSYWAIIQRGNDKRVQSVNQGTKVHLECDVITSGSGVKVEWMLPDLSLFESGNDQMDISERGELVILNSSLSDSGLYHCMVRTKASVDLLSVRLTVKERVLSPTAMNGQKMIVEKGQSLTLPCKVTTSLPSQTVWFLPQDQLLLPTQQTRRAHVMDNGTLVVNKLTQDDAGEYSCMASNLYGVDMLSHMVEVTGDKESYRSRVETEEGQPVLSGGEEEGEGSGVDYQEIKRLFVTQSPKNVATQQKNPMKRKRIKDSKRKSVNKSVKELDPNRWADMLAKANSKATTAVPTGPTEPSTTVLPEKPTYKPTTTIIPPTTKTSTTTTTALILPYTSSGRIANTKPEGHATEKERNMDISGKKRGFLRPSRKRPLGQLPRSNLPPVNRRGEDTSKSVTEPPFIQTSRTFKEPENRLMEKGRATSSKHSQGRPNRRRPPYRRRPPMRTVQPAQPTSTTTTTTASTTTTTTTASTTTTTTASTTTTTSTTTPTTVKMPESSTYNHQIDDYYDSEDSDDKDDDNLDEKEVTDSIHSEITENNGKEITFSKRQHLHNTNHFPTTKPYIMPYPTDVTVNDTERNSKIYERENHKLSVDMRKNGQTDKESKDLGGRQKQSSGRDDRWVEEVTQGYNTEDNIHKTTHNKPQPHPKPSEENITPAPTRTSTSKVISSQDKVIHPPQTKQKKPDMSSLPFAEPLHPWLHQHNQRVGQLPSSRVSHTDHDLSRRKEKYKEQSKQRETQKECKLSHVPPTPYWPSHHHHHHQYPLYYPSWPGQKSIHQPRQGAGSYPVPTRRTWPYTHLRTHGSMATNRPEITADTVKPTARFSQTTPYPSHPYNHHHDVGGGSYSVPGDRTQTRDHIILSKLRNRYRQAQLDRIAQLGRRVTYSLTPKPHIPPPHNPYKARQPVPTASVDNPKPKKPVLPALSPPLGHFPSPLPQPNTTPGVLYGSLWPYGGRIGSLRPTAVPPLSGRIEVGESGVRPPRITTVTTASVSVLAESDVYLPCEASGSPTPNLAWTKVSTGATIPANTKYGVRFEVLKNGTFIIRNMQLQDRGQYLCTAKNIFGSDRMVITLAIQTEPPKIQPPKSTEEAIYLGKTVSLHCLASGKPPAQIAWILPDRTFVRDVGVVNVLLPTVSLLQNGTLRIQSANFSSKGDYKCIASNVAGADTITYHLHVAALPPTITESLSDTVHIQQGSSVYIHCSGKGEPEPMLKWMLPSGVHVKPSQFLGRRLFIFPNGTLYVRNVVPADAGRYECSATNAVGLSKRTVQLVIRTDPPFSAQQPPLPPSLSLPIPPSNRQAIARPSQEHTVSAMYGSTVYLHCPESTSSQRGTVWQLPSKTLLEHRYSPERPFRVFRNGTLRILQLTEVDGGNYLCIFQRPNGEDMELFQVEVLMTPPRIEHLSTAQTKVSFGENFQVDCVATGMPDPEVSWSLPDGTFINNALQSDDSGLRNRRYVIFDNGTLLLQQMGKIDEGDYTCYAKNKLGRDERKLSVRVGPDAPKVRLNSQPSVTVRLGESVKLSCQSSGEPPPRIVWVSPGNDVISASSDRYQVLEVGVLVVKRVTLVDEGNYACVAQNSAGDDIKNIQLHVEPQEPFINGAKGRSTARVTAIYYQSTLLDCQAEGKPEPTVSWITPYGHTLPSPYLGGRFQVHGNGSLELRGVRKTDEGRFTCLAKSSLGEASLSVDLEVASLAEKPSFAVPNIEIIPIRQDSGEVMLECPARGKPHPEFAWVLPSGTVLSPGVKLQRFIHYLGNGTLRISQPSPGDKGVYRCVAKNVAGQAEKRYSLEVGRKPVIRGATGRIKITYGHSLNLPCSVDGWPQVSITWTLPNGVVLHKPQTTGRISFLVNGTLHLKEVATFDKGTYICKASNSYGSSTLSYPVSVMVFPPRITNAPYSITRVERGTPVTINCMAEGVPKPDISWTLPGRTTLVPHNRFTVQGGVHMTEEGSLVIQNPMLTNSGIYKCNAKNALGTDFKSTYVQVN